MLSAYLALLRSNRNFRLLWFAQIVSELGDWFYTLAVYNLLQDAGHALGGLLAAAPALLRQATGAATLTSMRATTANYATDYSLSGTISY